MDAASPLVRALTGPVASDVVASLVEPSVTVEALEPEKLTLNVRFPAPTRLRGQVEQDILRRFLSASPASPRSIDG